MSRLTRPEALDILTACGIEPGADFHALSSAQKDALLGHAKQRKYRKPTNASGSRARYFHAYVERAARTRMETWRVISRNHRPFTMEIAETDQRPLAECARTVAGRDDLDIVKFEPTNAVAMEVVNR